MLCNSHTPSLLDASATHRNEEATWDTPDAAKLLMRTILAQHAQALATLPAESRDGSLADLIAGRSRDLADTAVKVERC